MVASESRFSVVEAPCKGESHETVREVISGLHMEAVALSLWVGSYKVIRALGESCADCGRSVRFALTAFQPSAVGAVVSASDNPLGSSVGPPSARIKSELRWFGFQLWVARSVVLRGADASDIVWGVCDVHTRPLNQTWESR